MDSKELALKFAQSKGFISVDFQEKWNNYDVYIAQPSGEILTTGYPFFILVKDGKARENQPFELYDLMHFTEVSAEYNEELV